MAKGLRTAEFPFDFYPDHWGTFPIHEIFPLEKSLPALDVEHYQICVTPAVSQRTAYLGFDDFAEEWPVDPNTSKKLLDRRDMIRKAAKFRALVRVKRVKDLLPEGIERLQEAGADVSDAACKRRTLVVAVTGNYQNFPEYNPSPDVRKNFQVQYIHNFGAYTRDRNLHLASIDARTFVRCMLYIERIKLRHFMFAIHKEDRGRTPTPERTISWFIQKLMEKYPYALTSLEKVDSYRGARKHTSEIRHTFVCHAEWLYECTNLTNGPDPVVSRRILQRWAEKAPRKRELAARDRRQGWGVWDAQWDKEDPGKQFKREERRLRYQIRLNDKKAAETDSEEENASDDMRPEYDLPNRKYAGLNNQRRSGKDKDVEMRSAGWDDEESSDSGGWRGSKQGKARARGNGQENKSYKSHRKTDKGRGKGKAADYKHSWVKAPKVENESGKEEDDGGGWPPDNDYASLDDEHTSSKRRRAEPTHRLNPGSSPSLGGGGRHASGSSPSLGGGAYYDRSPGARGTQQSSPSLGARRTQQLSPSLGARGTRQTSQSLGGWGTQHSSPSLGGRGAGSTAGPSRRPDPTPSWRSPSKPLNRPSAGPSNTHYSAGAGFSPARRRPTSTRRGSSSLDFVPPTPTSVAEQFSYLHTTGTPKKVPEYIEISSDGDEDEGGPSIPTQTNIQDHLKRSSSSVIELHSGPPGDQEMREPSDEGEDQDQGGPTGEQRTPSPAAPSAPRYRSKPRRSNRLARRPSESDSEEEISESQGSLNSSDSESKYGRQDRQGPENTPAAARRKMVELNDKIRRFAPAVFYEPDLPTSWSAWRCTLPPLDMPLTTNLALAHEHKCTFVIDLSEPSEHVVRLLSEVSPELTGHLEEKRFRWVDEEIPTRIFIYVVEKHWEEHYARWGVKRVVTRGYMHFEEL